MWRRIGLPRLSRRKTSAANAAALAARPGPVSPVASFGHRASRTHQVARVAHRQAPAASRVPPLAPVSAASVTAPVSPARNRTSRRPERAMRAGEGRGVARAASGAHRIGEPEGNQAAHEQDEPRARVDPVPAGGRPQSPPGQTVLGRARERVGQGGRVPALLGGVGRRRVGGHVRAVRDIRPQDEQAERAGGGGGQRQAASRGGGRPRRFAGPGGAARETGPRRAA